MMSVKNLTCVLFMPILAAVSESNAFDAYRKYMEINADKKIYDCRVSQVSGFETDKGGTPLKQWRRVDYSNDQASFHIFRDENRRDETEIWRVIMEGSSTLDLFTFLEPSKRKTSGWDHDTNTFSLGRAIDEQGTRVFSASNINPASWVRSRWIAHGLCKKTSS